MRICFFWIWILVFLLSGVGWSDKDRELVQPLPHGYVNWSKGILVVKNTVDTDISQDSAHTSNAVFSEQITRNMFHSLSYIRVDARRNLADLIDHNDEIKNKLRKIVQASPIRPFAELPDGRVEMAIQMQLFGGLSQLMLPAEIKQVESIKAMRKSTSGKTASNIQTDTTDDVYTGLIVDARGIDVQPALVPVLLDENNFEVYGAEYVSREFAVQYGLCGYARSMGAVDHTRVGRRPLSVKGLHTKSRGNCDIVISNSDAAKLRSASAHLVFLKQCRVVILLD